LSKVPKDLIEWLALMQHHGAPTRLLHFRKSPFIASYFAFKNTDKIKSVAIWALNINILKLRAVNYLAESFHDALQVSNNQLTDKTFEQIFDKNDESCILPVEPFRINKRYYLQQSLFVSSGNSHNPFMEQLNFMEVIWQKQLLKFFCPQKSKMRRYETCKK
jgi:hypothetical protein